MKKLLLIFGILLSFTFVGASVEFFPYYDDNIFTAKNIFTLPSQEKDESYSTVLFDSFETEKIDEVKDTVEVQILKRDFDPKEITIKVGQSVTWENKRSKSQALLFGMREIYEMKSGFMEPGESFTWKFNKAGKYEYVDAIVIGMSGKIIVEE